MSQWQSGGGARMLDLVRQMPDHLRATRSAGPAGRSAPGATPPHGPALRHGRIGHRRRSGPTAAGWRGLLLRRAPRRWLASGVGPDSLVIVSSYSGNTAETLSALKEARARDCALLAITSGGALQEASRAPGQDGFPAVLLPGGLPPRAALGYGLGALLHGLHHLDLIENPAAELEAAVAELQRGNESYRGEDTDNRAAALAQRCRDRFLVIYTGSAEAHGAGLRLKAQINENAKSPAYAVGFPELNHNDIVGWRLQASQRDIFDLLILRSADESALERKRVAVTRELLAAEFGAVHEVRARGETPLARILSLVQFGDYLSCYLARAKGVDPVPVERIEILKQRLRKGNHK